MSGFSELVRQHINDIKGGLREISVRNRFFVDGYNYYLSCNSLAKKERKIALEVFEWHDKSLPDLPITAKVINEVGEQLLHSAENNLRSRYKKELSRQGKIAVDKIDVLLDAFNKARSRSKTIWQCEGAEVLITNCFEAELFFGGSLNLKLIERLLIKRRQRQPRKSSPAQLALVDENLKLIKEGKLRNAFTEYDLTSYQQFFKHLESLSGVEPLAPAITKFDLTDDGAVMLKEKGVDAKLIIAALDAAQDEDLEIIGLFSNDTDYYPLIERLKELGKFVVLLTGVPKDKISKKLVEVVGVENVLTPKTFSGLWPETQTEEYDFLRMELETKKELFEMFEHYEPEWNI